MSTDDLSALKAEIASTEAHLARLLARLAKLEGKPVVTGLDMLWQAALPIARTRSSKEKCRTEWNKIPKGIRPTTAELLTALKVWNRCDEWKKDGNAYVPGLHRWIKARQWEWLPESNERPAPKPRPKADEEWTQATEDKATPEEIRAAFAAMKSKFYQKPSDSSLPTDH